MTDGPRRPRGAGRPGGGGRPTVADARRRRPAGGRPGGGARVAGRPGRRGPAAGRRAAGFRRGCPGRLQEPAARAGLDRARTGSASAAARPAGADRIGARRGPTTPGDDAATRPGPGGEGTRAPGEVRVEARASTGPPAGRRPPPDRRPGRPASCQRPRFPIDRPPRPGRSPARVPAAAAVGSPVAGPAARPFSPRPPIGRARSARSATRTSRCRRLHRAAAAPELEEGEELIAGRRPVEEAFTAGRPPRRLLVTPQRRQALEKIVLHATTLRIPIVEVEGGSLTALAGLRRPPGRRRRRRGAPVRVGRRHPGPLDRARPSRRSCSSSTRSRIPRTSARCSAAPRPPASTASSSRRSARRRSRRPRSRPRRAPRSTSCSRPVDDLAGALTDLHLRGLRIVGSEADAALTAREADLRGPTAIVVGSEGHGLSPAIRRRCDLFVRIPMRGVIGSLNAAVAGSIMVFEVLGQRDPAAQAGRPARDAASGAPAAEPHGQRASRRRPARGAEGQARLEALGRLTGRAPARPPADRQRSSRGAPRLTVSPEATYHLRGAPAASLGCRASPT